MNKAELLTVADITPDVLAAFNLLIGNAETQKKFAVAMSAWGTAPAKYQNKEALNLVLPIYRYVNAIEAEQEKLSILYGNSDTESETTTNTQGVTTTTTHSGDDIQVYDQGKSDLQNMVYPTGYTGASDTAYLQSEQTVESDNDTTTYKHGETITVKPSGQNTTKRQYTNKKEIAESEFKLFEILEKLAFEYVADKWVYRDKDCYVKEFI